MEIAADKPEEKDHYKSDEDAPFHDVPGLRGCVVSTGNWRQGRRFKLTLVSHQYGSSSTTYVCRRPKVDIEKAAIAS